MRDRLSRVERCSILNWKQYLFLGNVQRKVVNATFNLVKLSHGRGGGGEWVGNDGGVPIEILVLRLVHNMLQPAVDSCKLENFPIFHATCNGLVHCKSAANWN